MQATNCEPVHIRNAFSTALDKCYIPDSRCALVNWQDVGDEVADVTHCLIDLLAIDRRDIEVETLKKLAVNKARFWTKNADGQIRHVTPLEIPDPSS